MPTVIKKPKFKAYRFFSAQDFTKKSLQVYTAYKHCHKLLLM